MKKTLSLKCALIIISICTALLFTRVANSSFPGKQPQLFASEDGHYGFKLLPRMKGAPDGILFGINENGSDRVLWKRQLVNYPSVIHIHNGYRNVGQPGQSAVATIGSNGPPGYRHSVVTYNSRGEATGDFALEDLLPEQEIADHVPSKEWRSGAKFVFWTKLENDTHYVPIFRIIFKWGKKIDINMDTGKIEPQTP